MTSIGTIAIGFTYLRNLRRLASPHKIVKRTSKPVRIPEKALKGQVLTHRAGYICPQFAGVTLICIVYPSPWLTQDILGSRVIRLLALLSLLSTSGIAPSVRCGSAQSTLQSANSLRPDALRILGLIPREPTPPPLEERPEDELSQDELRQLVKELKVR
jgi:hypothetical protein